MSKLNTFTPDPNNANKGTPEGRVMLGESIKDLGAGRSILVDSNGVVIAGNKTLEAATKAGIEDALVVETDGTRLVVVKRTDLDLTKDKKAKLMAIADNRVAELDLNWDTEVLENLSTEVDLSRLFPEGFDLDVSDVGEDYEPGEYQGDGYDSEDEDDDIEATENPYTTKVATPIYEIRGDKPEVDALFSKDRTNTLIADIRKSNVPPDVADFLIAAAHRHTVFQYDQIAEFYAHADSELQKLMEDSALVVIDFDRAIELGFVKLSAAIVEQYKKDYPDAE